MKVLIDEAAIRKLTPNNKIFIRGRNLFNAKERLGPVFYDSHNLLVSAKVSSFSGHIYDSFVSLRSNGAPVAASCSCAAFGQFKGCCKHVTALLLGVMNQDLPDDGSMPEMLPADHPLRGIPQMQSPLLTFEELLHITGPNEKAKKRRGRPTKEEEAAREESASPIQSQEKINLLVDQTQVMDSGDEYVRIFPGQSRSQEEIPKEEVYTASPEMQLPAGERFLNRLFNWEEREQNLQRSRELQERLSDSLRMEITVEIIPGQAQNSQLTLRIGIEEHLYVVNQIGALLEAIQGREALVFGNYFTWEMPERLNRAQQLFFDWLKRNWYETWHTQRRITRREPVDGKALTLTRNQLADFLNLAIYCDGDLPVLLRLPEGDVPLVVRNRIPRDFQLRLNETENADTAKACEVTLAYRGKALEVATLSDLHSANVIDQGVILLHENGIFLYDSVIYTCESQGDRLFWQILRSLSEEKDYRLTLSTAEVSYFLGSAHELLREENRLIWADGLTDRLVEVPLEIKVFVDVRGETIFLSPFFTYGDYHFRPLLPGAVPMTREGKPANVLIVRDGKAEMDFENVLKEWGFSEVKLKEEQLGPVTKGSEGDYLVNQFYLKGNDRVFGFVSETIQEVQKVAKVFVSPAFREIQVREPDRPKVELAYESDGNVEILISMENFSDTEASSIVRAMQQGHAYVCLADGSFVDLGENRKLPPGGEELRQLVKTLAAWNAIWRKDRFVVAKYRSLALHGLLEDKQIAAYTNDERAKQAWENLIRDRENPAAAAPEIPPGVRAELRPYQVQGYQWLCFLDRYDMGGILADEMGLGKTLQMLVFLYGLYRRQPGPMLVVAPTSLLYNWLAEAKRFVPDLPVQVVEGIKAQRNSQYKDLKDFQGLLIVSYGLARQDRKELKEFHFECIVLDEAQNIKNPMTKTTRAVKSLRAKRRFALTGTPLENHIGELWSIFDFIMPGYLFSYSTFQERFGQMAQKHLTLNGEEAKSPFAEASQNKSESLHHLVSPFIMRRLKQEVLKDLPDKIITDIPCQMTPEQQQLYRKHLALAKRQLSDFDTANNQEKNRKRMDILGELTRLRQICCDPALFVPNYTGGSGKLEALADLVDNLTESGHRILLFSQFTSMLAIIREQQEKAGRNVLYIDGQVAAKERLERVANFNSGEGDIFLISLRAGGTGLNLTGADVVIHYDPWWNPAVENQATDRAHRMGQRKVVQVFRMVTIGSIEEKIQELQQRKQALLDDIVSPGATFLNKMDLEDIRGLFEEE